MNFFYSASSNDSIGETDPSPTSLNTKDSTHKESLKPFSNRFPIAVTEIERNRIITLHTY